MNDLSCTTRNDTCIDTDMNLKTNGDVVKFQKSKNWSQQTLAEKFRLSLRTVNNIHKRDPKDELTEFIVLKIDQYKRSLK